MKNNIKTQKFYVPKWTKRWFSIEGTTLKWYASEHTAEASGNINIKVRRRQILSLCLGNVVLLNNF